MSFTVEFPSVSSGFANSPFGESWHISELDFGLGVSSYKKPKLSASLRRDISKLNDLYYNTIEINRVARVLVLLKEDAVLNESIEPRTDDVRADVGFSREDLAQLHSVQLGMPLHREEMSSSDVGQLARDIVSWLFTNDSQAISELHGEVVRLINEDLARWRDKSNIPNWLKLLLSAWREAFEKVLGGLFRYAADLVRNLRIDDPKYWNPLNEPYEPLLAFGQEIDLTELNNLKERIASDAKAVVDSESTGTDEDQKEVMNYVLSFFGDTLVEMYNSITTAVSQFLVLVIETLHIANAFLVGIWNGLVEMVAGIFELIAELFELANPQKFDEFLKGVKDFFISLTNGTFVDMLSQIWEAFKAKYSNAENQYLVAKYLGEDIAEILLNVVVAIVTGGAGSVTIVKLLKKFKKLVDDSDDLLDFLKQRKKGRDKDRIGDGVRPDFSHLDIDTQVKLKKADLELDKVKADPSELKRGTNPRTGESRKENDFTRKGNFGEMATDVDVLSKNKNLRPLHRVVDDLDLPTTRGLDHVYINTGPPPPKKLVIVESKFDTSTLSDTKSGKQMSDTWIDDRIDDYIEEYPELAGDYAVGNYDRVLANVDESGKISYTELGTDGAKTGDFKPFNDEK